MYEYAEVTPNIFSIIWVLDFQPLVITLCDDEVNIIAMLAQPVILHCHPADKDRFIEKGITQFLDIDGRFKFYFIHWISPK